MYCDIGTSQPTLHQLFNTLKPVSANWYTLGIKLDYDAGKLAAIEANHQKVEDRMRDLCSQWLRKYPNKGWSDIVAALREMDRNDVADQVQRLYISPSPSMAVMGGFEI